MRKSAREIFQSDVVIVLHAGRMLDRLAGEMRQIVQSRQAPKKEKKKSRLMPKGLPDIDLSAIGPTTPLRLKLAACLAYPDGSMTASGLRREIARGRLECEHVAGKQYVTLAGVERMRALCRVSPKVPASISEGVAAVARPWRRDQCNERARRRQSFHRGRTSLGEMSVGRLALFRAMTLLSLRSWPMWIGVLISGLCSRLRRRLAILAIA